MSSGTFGISFVVVAFHQLRHGQLLLLVGGEVGGVYLLWLELLAVNFSGEVPILRVVLALVGMAVGHFAAVGCHHLRFARLAFLFRPGLLFHIGIRLCFGLPFCAFLTGRFLLYLIRGRLDRLVLHVLHGLVFLFLCHISIVGYDFFFYL